MKTEHVQTLGETFCRVLEQLAFMFPEPAAKSELPTHTGEYVSVSMGFKGVFNGTLRLAAPSAICAEIAVNMLGMDLDDEEVAAKGLDALKEVLNVTCGNILTEIAGDEAVFALDIPEATIMDASGWSDLLRHDETLCFLIDDCPALLQFQGEGSIA